MRASRSSSPGLFDVGRPRRFRIEIENRRTFGADDGALINRRQPAARPVADAVDRHALRIGERDVRRQILVFGPESVRDPRGDVRASADRQAGLRHPDRLLVVAVFGIHRADDGDVVGVLRDVRQNFGEFEAALAVFGELVRAAEQVARPLFVVVDFRGGRLAVVFGEFGLGVEQIDVAGTAVHEELDDGFRFWRMMRRSQFQVEFRRYACGFAE
jgi:hypothetical protein